MRWKLKMVLWILRRKLQAMTNFLT
ncbi:hypothetical protein Avbf_02859 [Armadillidium vulgare]|nr:hypothetical protein Avbf_02859 [Armadillidium vulgare]